MLSCGELKLCVLPISRRIKEIDRRKQQQTTQQQSRHQHLDV